MLVDALRSDDPNLRQAAAMQLGTRDTSLVMGELVLLMASESDDFVRETLVWAVVARPEAATPQLVDALGQDGVPREPVLHALSKIGDPSTVPAIAPHAADADRLVAAKAWWALGRIGAAEGLPVALEHLGDPDAARRHGLTRALLQFGEPAIDALKRELSSEDAGRRSHAAEVLVAFADPDQYGLADRRGGRDLSEKACAVVLAATCPEMDGALLLATMDDDRAGLAAVAARLREERP